jgi:uncharacterized protein (DUF3084 family)
VDRVQDVSFAFDQLPIEPERRTSIRFRRNPPSGAVERPLIRSSSRRLPPAEAITPWPL